MFSVDYASLFHGLPPGVAVLLIAMLPIAELRLAIPIGLETYGLNVWSTFVWACLGNIAPVILLLLFLEPASRWLMEKSTIFNRFFTWLFDRTRKRFSASAEKYGKFIALMLFVAVPLPVTGAWTGAAAAFLFGMPFKRSLLAISLGVVIAGIIVTIITKGVTAIF
ncbi:MAG: small multi-drug export protein [Patescibacteria group bacterium]